MFFFVTLLILTDFMKAASESFKVIGPAAHLNVEKGEDVVLPCSLRPNISAEDMRVEWSKLGERSLIVHLYQGRADRNGEQFEDYRGRTSLFKEELKNGNTSLKLSAVQPSDEGLYNCLIESSSEYDDVNIEVQVIEQVFHAWKIALTCILLFSFGLIVFAAFIWKGSPLHRKRELSPVQCSAIAYMRLNSETVRNEWDLKKYKTSEAGYRRLIPAITNCRKAQLAGFNLTKGLITILRKHLQSENTSLKELDLSYTNLQGSMLKELSDGLKRLETLRLMRCKLSNESVDTVQSILQSENSLKNLDLSNNEFQDSRMETLCAGLRSPHCKLETLKLAGCNLTKRLIQTLSEALQSKNSSLKELDFSKNDLHGSRLDELCAGVWNLEKLRLMMCKLSEESCEVVQLILQSKNSCLKNLDLSYNDLQDSGVEKLCVGLKNSHCKLETLRLSGCCLGEKTGEQLSPILENYSLKDLDLSNNDLQDSGVEKLYIGMRSPLCKLETLRLSGCMITEKGCSSLALALSSNTSHLKELDLSYNHPGDTGEKLLSDKKKQSGCKLNKLRMEHVGVIRIKSGQRKYACELTLDPNTVHTFLILSEREKNVTSVKEEQSYPDHPERFNDWEQVLCRESLTGRCYWETEWSGREVYISVTYKSIRRKGDRGDCRFGANEKSWSLSCFNNRYSVYHNKNRTDLPPPPSRSNRVGVYMDHEAGILSFYSVSTDTNILTHLHTFTTTFTEPLCAGFRFDYYDSSVSLCQIE